MGSSAAFHALQAASNPDLHALFYLLFAYGADCLKKILPG
jgi:hypothetical protein